MAMSKRKKTSEIGNLPCDLVICIFLCLPIKSLLRCLLVCKSFRAIIRSRNFLQLHLARQDDCIFIYHHPRTIQYPTPKHSMNHYRIHDLAFTKSLEAQHPLESNTSVHHIGSCRGLICFLRSTNVYFWNPAIRKFKTTSLAYRDEAFSSNCSVNNTIGYGFVPRINDFKLVRLKRDRTARGKVLHQVDVYTLGLNTWRRIKDNVSGTIKNSHQASVNGIVYWMAEVKKAGESTYNYILGFSLDNEVFHEIALPENFSNYGLHEYKDTLCIHNLSRGKVCEIWVKKDQCSAHPWLKLYSFNFPKYDPRVSILMKNDELLIPGRGGTLSLCDPKDVQLIKTDIPPLKDIELSNIEKYPVKALNYTESLVLLD